MTAPTPPKTERATRESVLREYRLYDPFTGEHGINGMAQALADAQNEITRLLRDKESLHAIFHDDLTAENDRLRALIDATGAHWLAVDNNIPWEGAIDSAMEAAMGEIRRLRALITAQGEPASTPAKPLYEGWAVVYNEVTSPRWVGDEPGAAMMRFDVNGGENGHAGFTYLEAKGLARCIPVQIVAKKEGE